jgi:hypothetical protein
MTGADVFEALGALVGRWSGVADDGHVLHVAYSLHARNSVLMEHWQLKTSDALTLYHMDGLNLMATHYCPLCNQPRLDLVDAQDSHFQFAFVSATNLANLELEHQHSFEIKLVDQENFWRSESYLAADIMHTYPVTYRRE